MAGVAIDFETKGAAVTEKQLSGIEKALSKIKNGSISTKTALNGVGSGTAGIKDINREAKKTGTSLKSMGSEGKTALDKTSQSGKTTAGILNKVVRTASLLGGAFLAIKGTTALTKMADDLTSIQNKLRLVTEGYDDLIRTQNKLYKLSRETRSDLASTTASYAGLTKGLERYGLSQKRIMDITKTIQKQTAMSSGSVESKKAGLVQLGQGLTSELRGQELRSVFEQLDYMSFKMQEHYKMGVGGLMKYAEGGNLAGMEIVRMFEAMADGTEKDFNRSAIAVSAALSQMKNAFAYFFGDINSHYGISQRTSENIIRFTNNLDGLSFKLTSRLYIVTQEIRNFFMELEAFSAFDLTVKAMLNLEISPFDFLEKRKELKKIKGYIDSFNGFIGKFNLNAVTSNILPEEDVDNATKSSSRLKEKLIDLVSIVPPMFSAIAITIKNLLSLMPSLVAPVIDYTSEVKRAVVSLYADINKSMFDAMMPIVRRAEEIFGFLNFFTTLKDTRLENTWVRLFKSDSLVEFRENLLSLNKLRSSMKLDDKQFIYEEKITRPLKGVLRSMRNVLISVGLVENKLIRIHDVRLDRIVLYFKNIAKVLSRIFSDIIAPNLTKIQIRLNAIIAPISRALLDAFGNTFNEQTGRATAEAFVNGIVLIFKGLKYAVSALFTGTLDFSSLFKDINELDLASNFVKGLFSITKSLANFVKGFTSQLVIEIFPSLDDNSFEKAFKAFFLTLAKIEEIAKATLGRVLSVVTRFGDAVKEVFWNIWDKVVGHSYWPDTMEGILDSTRDLDSVIPKIENFGKRVLESFSKIFKYTRDSLSQGTDIFQVVVDSFADIEWGDVLKRLATNLGASLLAAIMFVFGGAKLKFAAAAYFSSTFVYAIGESMSAIGPAMANFLGASMAVMGARIAESMLRAFDAVLLIAPKFLVGFLDGLSPITGLFDDIFGMISSHVATVTTLLLSIPHKLGVIALYAKNTVVQAIMAMGLAYAIFAKKGFKTIGELIFGKKKNDGTRSKKSVMGYFNSIFPSPTILGRAIAAMASPALAVAAGLIFASIGFESVSFLDAALVGGPLLLFAFLGRNRGAAVIREIIAFSGRLFRDVVFMAGRYIGARTGLDAVFSNLFTPGPRVVSRARQRLRGTTRLLGQELMRSFMSLRANIAAYAAGTLSLTDIFSNQTGRRSLLGMRFNNFMSAALNMTGHQAAITTAFRKLRFAITLGILDLQLVFSALSARLMGSGVIASVKAMFAKLTSLFIAGFGLLRRTALSKWIMVGSVFTIAYFGLSSIANAAGSVSDVMSEAGTAAMGFSKSLLAITSLILALGVAAKGLVIFSSAKSEFTAATGITGLQATLAGLAGVTGAVSTGFRNIGRSAGNAFRGMLGAIARPADMLLWMNNTLHLFQGRLRLSAVQLASLTRATTTFRLALISLSFSSFLTAMTGFMEIFKSLGVLLRVTLVQSFAVFGRAVLATGALFAPLISVVSSLASALMLKLAVGLGWVIGALMWLIKPILIITAAISAIGVIGLWLFGPDDKFLNNLEWAYDKIKGIFGAAPKSATGRFQKIVKSLPESSVGGERVSFVKDFLKIDFDEMSSSQFNVLEESSKATKDALNALEALFIKQGELTDAQIAERERIIKEQHAINLKMPEKGKQTYSGLIDGVTERILEVDNSMSSVFLRALGMTPDIKMTASELARLNSWIGKLGKTAKDVIKEGKATPTVERIATDLFNLKTALPWRGEITAVVRALIALPREIEKIADKNRDKRDVSGSLFAELFSGSIDKPTEDEQQRAKRLKDATSKVAKYSSYLPQEDDELFRNTVKQVEELQLLFKQAERGYKKYEQKMSREEYFKLFDYDKIKEALDKSFDLLELRAETLRRKTENLFKYEKISNEFKNLAGSLEGIVDIGKDGSKLFANFKESAVLKNMVDTLLRLREMKPPTYEGRVKLLIDQENLENDIKMMVERINSSKSLALRVAFDTKAISKGISEAALNRAYISQNASAKQTFSMQRTDSMLFKKFANPIETMVSKTTDEIINLEKRIKDLPLDAKAEEGARLRNELKLLYNSLNAQLSDGVWLDKLNNDLQAIGAPILTDITYAFSGEAELNRHKSLLDSVESKMYDIATTMLFPIDPSIEKRQADLRELIALQNNLKISGIILKATTAEGIMGTSTSNLGKGNLLQQLTNVEMPTIVGARGKQKEYNELLTKKLKLESEIASLNDPSFNSPLSQKGIDTKAASLYKELLQAEKAISEMSKVDDKVKDLELTFSKLLNTLGDTGIAISDLSFSRLTVPLQRELIALGGALADINDKITKAAISGTIGSELNALIESRTAKLKAAGTKMLKALYSTGNGLLEAFKRIGVESIDSAVALYGTQEGRGIILLDAEIKSLELANSYEGDIDQFFARLGNISKLTKLKGMVSFFEEMRTQTTAALTNGAKTAYENIKSILGDNTLEFTTYLKLPSDIKQRLKRETADLGILTKAADLNDLDPKYRAVLEEFKTGKSAADVLAKFKEQFNFDLKDLLKSPTEKLAGTIERLADVLTNWVNAPAFNGGVQGTYGIDEKKAPQTGAQTETRNNEGMSSEFHEATLKAGEKLKLLGVDSIESVYDKLIANLALTGQGLDKGVAALAGKERLTRLNATARAIYDEQQKRDELMTAGLYSEAAVRQLAIEDLKEGLSNSIAAITYAGEEAKQAGVQFNSSLAQGFSSAVGDLMRGKSDEDESVFTTFLKGLANSFTDSVINTFTQSIASKLMGPDSDMGKILKDLGESIFNMLSDIFKSIQSAMADGGGPGIGSILFKGLMSIGSAFAGGVSSATTSSGAGLIDLKGMNWGGRAEGGLITGQGTGTSDSILTWLSNREFVVNAKSTKKFLPLLERINSAKKFAKGGLVGGQLSMPSDSTITKSNGNSSRGQQVINLTITGDISRQTKSEIFKMLPTIANGVNAHNREKGYK